VVVATANSAPIVEIQIPGQRIRKKLYVDYGDMGEAGQLLADSTSAARSRRTRLRANLQAAEAALILPSHTQRKQGGCGSPDAVPKLNMERAGRWYKTA